MITGEGTPLNILQANGRSVKDLAQYSTFVSKDNPSAQKDSSGKTDIVELSKEARNFLNNSRNLLKDLVRGQEEISNKEREFIEQRLAQVREQIQFLKGMITAASPAQAGAIMKGIENAAETLEKIGQQLGIVNQPSSAGALQGEYSSVEVTAINLKASFNETATYRTEDGNEVTVSQSLDIEFSFLQIKASTGAQEAGQTQEQAPQSFKDLAAANSGTPLFLAQLNNADTTATSEKSEAGILQELKDITSVESIVPDNKTIEEFSEVLHGLTETIKEFEEYFTDEERVPPSLYSLMKNLVSSTLDNSEINKEAAKVDRVA